MHRGHVEMTLTLEYAGASGVSVNQELVAGYVKAFRRSATSSTCAAEPDLNAVFRLNGVLAGLQRDAGGGGVAGGAAGPPAS